MNKLLDLAMNLKTIEFIIELRKTVKSLNIFDLEVLTDGDIEMIEECRQNNSWKEFGFKDEKSFLLRRYEQFELYQE